MDLLAAVLASASLLLTLDGTGAVAAGPVAAPRFPRPAVAPIARARPLPPVAADDPLPQAPFRYSAAYYRRLDIHRAASWAILPLFAFQYAAGTQLYDKGASAPAWARRGHPVGAAAIGTLFAVNSVTGVWNLWEGRRDPARGARPVLHGVLMLAAEAGFVATAVLAERAEGSPDDRRLHRTVALSSMGVATTAYLLMLDLFRRD